MSLAVVGVNHRTAPLEVRERFVFAPGDGAAALARLTADGEAREAVLLSTCNRTELYLRLPEHGAGVEAGTRLLAARAGYRVEEASKYLYVHQGRQSVEHLFRVVSSLDSMVLGEAQIQGQVKAAYEAAANLAVQPRLVGPVLSRLFQMALAVGGRVRSETALGAGAASVPSAAVELAKKIFGSLKGRRALVLGAGEMSALMIECLNAEGVTSISVASRTEEGARELTDRMGGLAISFDQVVRLLPEVDIVAAATSAPHTVVTRELLERALPGGRRRPLFIIDIALPRDVEPAVGEMENVFLYDIDDLRQFADDNLERRRQEVPAAERIVAEGVEEFWRWYASLEVVPLIRSLRSRAERVRRLEVERALRKLKHLAPADRAAVEVLSRQILNKLLHPPTVRLREAATDGERIAVLDAARYLFELDVPLDGENE